MKRASRFADRPGQSVQSGIRNVDFARDGKSRHTLSERRRWRSPSANICGILAGATGSPLPVLPAPSPSGSAAKFGRARPTAGGRLDEATGGRAAAGEELPPDV